MVNAPSATTVVMTTVSGEENHASSKIGLSVFFCLGAPSDRVARLRTEQKQQSQEAAIALLFLFAATIGGWFLFRACSISRPGGAGD